MKKRKNRSAGAMINTSSVFLMSDRELTVTKCEKVEKYCPDSVVLKLSDMRLEIEGEEMTFAVCYGSEIKLTGKITKLTLKQKQ